MCLPLICPAFRKISCNINLNVPSKILQQTWWRRSGSLLSSRFMRWNHRPGVSQPRTITWLFKKAYYARAQLLSKSNCRWFGNRHVSTLQVPPGLSYPASQRWLYKRNLQQWPSGESLVQTVFLVHKPTLVAAYRVTNLGWCLVQGVWKL